MASNSFTACFGDLFICYHERGLELERDVCMSSYNLLTTLATTMVVLAIIIIPLNIVFAIAENSITQQQQQPDIKASDIYQYYTMVLGKDIKNLVIVIPNEGHEDPNQFQRN